MSLDYRPVLVATAIRFMGFVMIAAFGKVRRVIFASDRRIDALAQVPRYRNLVIQVSERVAKRWLHRIHNHDANLGCNGCSIPFVKSTRESHTSFPSPVVLGA
jgi:hypothetical protein